MDEPGDLFGFMDEFPTAAGGRECAALFLAELRKLGASAGQYVTAVLMELCGRGTLLQRIEEERQMQQEAAADLLRCALEVAQGMAYLHSMNILHGDLKPANVLLCHQYDDYTQALTGSSISGTSPLAAALERGAALALGGPSRNYCCKVADFGPIASPSRPNEDE
ncbi:putative serine/threonine-protein kinase [Tetrabaena socialis]|uniref:Putative serine/threonine-protein kinase n=1 Tax=Tetrabaena socialis TaxID=47790 RepID=A0A2J8AGN8_9CHLO|nr:putative serine/threonine-protein kinase [Tetrabaena socialis]|eukprot:PNH11666.1 putative serine/threonine-protein kinase [Tetrabaena socialis]